MLDGETSSIPSTCLCYLLLSLPPVYTTFLLLSLPPVTTSLALSFVCLHYLSLDGESSSIPSTCLCYLLLSLPPVYTTFLLLSLPPVTTSLALSFVCLHYLSLAFSSTCPLPLPCSVFHLSTLVLCFLCQCLEVYVVCLKTGHGGSQGCSQVHADCSWTLQVCQSE